MDLIPTVRWYDNFTQYWIRTKFIYGLQAHSTGVAPIFRNHCHRGNFNVAKGNYALNGNTIGRNNVAVGYQALNTNNTGINNTAFGYQTLNANTSGFGNVTQGSYAMTKNTTAFRNIGIGNHALGDLTTGNTNVAFGDSAGVRLTTSSHNLDLANQGQSTDGIAANSGVIRIGAVGRRFPPTLPAFIAPV